MRPSAFGILGNNGRQHVEWNVEAEVLNVAFVRSFWCDFSLKWSTFLHSAELPALHLACWVDTQTGWTFLRRSSGCVLWLWKQGSSSAGGEGFQPSIVLPTALSFPPCRFQSTGLFQWPQRSNNPRWRKGKFSHPGPKLAIVKPPLFIIIIFWRYICKTELERLSKNPSECLSSSLEEKMDLKLPCIFPFLWKVCPHPCHDCCIWFTIPWGIDFAVFAFSEEKKGRFWNKCL